MGAIASFKVASEGAGGVEVVIAKRDSDRAKHIVQKFFDERFSE